MKSLREYIPQTIPSSIEVSLNEELQTVLLKAREYGYLALNADEQALMDKVIEKVADALS